MSTSNNQRLIIRQLRCRDIDPRTKAEFCGLVVKSRVESGTLTVSPRMTGKKGCPNWARGHFDIDSHLGALQCGYFKRLYRLSKETFLELATLITPRLERKKSREPGKVGSIDPSVMLAITLRFLAEAKCMIGIGISPNTATAFPSGSPFRHKSSRIDVLDSTGRAATRPSFGSSLLPGFVSGLWCRSRGFFFSEMGFSGEFVLLYSLRPPSRDEFFPFPRLASNVNHRKFVTFLTTCSCAIACASSRLSTNSKGR
jgi:hypothetical protein